MAHDTRVRVGDPALAAVARDAVDGLRVDEVGPTGSVLDPLVSVTVDGETTFYATPTAERVVDLAVAASDGRRPAEGAVATARATDDRLPRPDDGPLSVGTRRVLAGAGWRDPTTADRTDEDPDAVLETIRAAGLLGRGRGDAAHDGPVVDEWEAARGTDGDPVVVVNAADADDQQGDRLLCASLAGEVVDGALVVARVVGAEDVVVACTDAERDELARERLQTAAERVETDRTVQVVAGPDAFMATEPTMALEALEGADRIEARRRPPGPSEWGLHGRPTVVHTPRTLAQVRALVRGGDHPERADVRTRLVTVVGDVERPATVELRTDSPLQRALDAVTAEEAKMYCVGGQFGGFTRSLDLPASAGALAAAGLGTEGSVEILDRSRCAVATAGARTRFAREENCGRCVPCREGSKQLLGLLRAVYDGEYDGEAIRELARTVRDTSLCSFGVAAARPVLTALDEFEGEFRAHAQGRCLTGACGGRP